MRAMRRKCAELAFVARLEREVDGLQKRLERGNEGNIVGKRDEHPVGRTQQLYHLESGLWGSHMGRPGHTVRIELNACGTERAT